MKSFLFVLNNPPYDGLATQETLDVILTLAAFDQPVSLLLLDDGIFQLKLHQRPEQMGLKNTNAIFQALKIYEVYSIYIETESLQERGLGLGELSLPVIAIDRKDVADLMKKFQIIYGG